MRGMDDKENICAENDLGMTTLSKETPVLGKSIRMAKRCNLRKSLAWNKAFFTEEGVLDPLELSIITGSVTKAGASSLSGVGGGMSPLTRFNLSRERSRPVGCDLDEKICGVTSAKSHVEDASDTSTHEESQVSGRLSSAKGMGTILQSPALYSLKRVANTTKINPTSKIPKFMSTKTSTLSSTSKSVRVDTDNSMCNQTMATASTPHNTALKGLLSDAKKDVNRPSSADCSRKVMVDKHSSNSMMNLNPSFQRKTHGPIISSSSNRPASLLPKADHQICGRGPPAPAHVKPSALRMPSPRIGFFSQRNVPLSYGSQSNKCFQPSISNITPRKVTNEKRFSKSRPQSARTEQKPVVDTSVSSSPARNAFGSSLAFSAASCSRSSTTTLDSCHNLKSCIKSKLEMEHQDEVHRKGSIASQISNCSRKGQELKFDCSSVSDNTNEQSQHSSCGNPNRDGAQTIPVDNVLPVKIDENRPVSLKNAHNASHNSASFDGSRFSCHKHSITVCDPCKPQETNLDQQRQGESGSSNQAMHLHSEYTKDRPSTVLSEDKQAVGNSITVSELVFAVKATGCKASESSLRLSKEQVEGNDVSNSSKLDHSSAEGTGWPFQPVVPGPIVESCAFSYVSSDKLKSSKSDGNMLDCQHHLQHAGEINLQKEGAVVPELQESALDHEIKLQQESTVVPVLQDTKKILDTSKSDVIPLRNQINAIPFSDEWLAAVEAIGEDILEMKTGPVQNSPPDKALPEPSPWSPVKRKAQDVGPFDCTKYSRNLSSADT